MTARLDTAPRREIPPNPTELPEEEWMRRVTQGYERWDKIGPEIARRFEQVIQDAKTSREWKREGRHPREVEAMIERRLNHLLYVPQLASGGADEARTAQRLVRLANKLSGDSRPGPTGAAGLLRMLAGKYRELAGRYYIFKPLSEPLRAIWEKHRKEAQAQEDVEACRACETVLKGIPAWITDFVVDSLYVLVRTNGTRERVVRLRNVHGGTTGVLHWPSEELGSPKPMRTWLNNNSNCANWAAGERELNYLGMDIGQALNDKEVMEVPIRGHHYPSGIWFWADCAPFEGKPLRRDPNGVYWLNGKGFLPGEKDQEGEFFRMGPKPQLPGPCMHPMVEVKPEEAQAIWKQSSQDMHDALGGHAGTLALGAALAPFASKEMLERYSAIPGLWISAEPGQGKSSVTRWMMRIYGYQGKTGLPIPGSTQAALLGAMQQYGDLPLWLDEFQARCEPWVIDIAKAAYDRGGRIKKTFGEQPREIRASLIISGVATSTDAQLRSRYVHVQVAAANRINFDKDRYLAVEQWTLDNLYKIGRFILEHREEFARLMMEQVAHRGNDHKLVNCDDRSRTVHGAAYSAFVALSNMLETHGAEYFAAFKQYVRGHIEGAQVDVREQLYVTQFFEHLLGAERTEFLGRTVGDLRRFGKMADKNETEAAASIARHISPCQQEIAKKLPYTAWKPRYLYLFGQGAVEAVMAYRRNKLGITENLSRKDLQEQMKGRPWFIPPPPGRTSHSVRFEGGAQETAWKIDLDEHEMGRLEVSDEEFEASLHPPGKPEVYYPSTEWQDPRKGPLYALVERLLQKDPD